MAEPPPKPLRAKLVSLDHQQPDDTTDEVAKAAPALTPGHFDLVGLDGDEAHAHTAELAEPELIEDVEELDDAVPVAPARVVDPFAAPAVSSVQMELDHPHPVVSSFARPEPAVAAEHSDDDDAEPGQLAPEPVVHRPIPGKIAQGALRQNPPLRLGLGLAAGLLVGYIAATPYARRVERHVNALRSDANVDRYRPFEEAHQNAARLDAEADDRASSGAIGTGAIWLLVGGAVVLGWYRFT